MAKAPKLLQVPFFVIAYNPKILFSVDDENGVGTLPIFTDAAVAERYRRFFARKFKLKLQVCVADKLENGLNLIECASLACKTLKYAVINPPPPLLKNVQPKLKPIQMIIASLLSQHQKAHNRRSPRKK